MGKPLVLIALALVVTGCEKPPGPTHTFELTKLFSVEGCDVYRFWDTGEPVYFVICPHGDPQAFWQRHGGKTSVPMEVPTNG